MISKVQCKKVCTSSSDGFYFNHTLIKKYTKIFIFHVWKNSFVKNQSLIFKLTKPKLTNFTDFSSFFFPVKMSTLLWQLEILEDKYSQKSSFHVGFEGKFDVACWLKSSVSQNFPVSKEFQENLDLN